MARASRRPKLVLTDEEKTHLDQLRQSRTAAFRDVQRAQILWRYHAGETVSQIARARKMTRKSVLKWIDKTLQIGAKAGMKDAPHKPREAGITDDAKAWVVHLACCKPKEFGYAAELWTRSALARHVRKQAMSADYPALARAAKATVQRILDAQPLHPHKVTYYLERRDPRFLPKMQEVLLVYQQVALQNEAVRKGAAQPIVITVSVDEKPGVQAIGNTAPDLPPVAGKYPTVARDHEYIRYGTWSILAGLDLHDGHVTARVEERHRSVEFIAGFGCPLPAGVHDSADPGQPLRAHFQRDAGLLGDAPQPVQVRADSYAWLLAEYRGDPLWQDDAHVPAADSGAIQSGTERAYSVGYRRNQRDAGGPSLEGVRTTGGHLRGGLIIWIRFTETIY